MTITPELIALGESQIVEQSKRIDFYLVDYSVELLAAKMANGDFEIPPYQREDVWEDGRKSRFIESLLMGLPIPFLFFWESPATGKLEIVDGAQRLRTIHQFILGDLTLGELERLPALEGLQFRNLPESRQRKVKNRPIRGIVLNEHGDEQARSDLFERINTGSKIAEIAEVRRGALGGPFLDLAIELAKDPGFEELAPVSEQNKKLREREELVTRFFAFGDGLDGYRDRVSEFLFAYAKKMNGRLLEDASQVEVYRARFHRTMEFVRNTFPNGFRRAKGGTETPRARFEALAIGSYLALELQPELKPSDVSAWLEGGEFREETRSDGANAKKKLASRMNFVRDRLLGRA